MATKPQTVVRMTIIGKNGYCPVFSVGQTIIIKKYCFDTALNRPGKYCYATLADIYPVYYAMRKKDVGTKDCFTCRDNGIIKIEVERWPGRILRLRKQLSQLPFVVLP